MQLPAAVIGQHYPGDSVLHLADPRAKVVVSLLFAGALFACRNFPGLAILAAGLMLGFAVAGVPARLLARGIVPVLFIMAVAVAAQAFLYGGEQIVALGPLAVYREGLLNGALIASRLLLLVLSGLLLTYTSATVALADAFSRLLSPLAALRLPVAEVALMMTIAVRFIPVLITDFNRVVKAQSARGGAIGRGHPLGRARNLFPVLIPLLVISFRHADNLALAMEARRWRGTALRTQRRRLKFGRRDTAFCLVAVLFIAVGVIAGNIDLW